MTIQSQLDKDALNKLPIISHAIENASTFEANQMRYVTLRECMNGHISLDEMSETQIRKFEQGLMERFKYNDWIR